MPLAYLTESDWGEFYKSFPGADAWLTLRVLQRELENLESIACATPWMEKRREELRQWKADRDAIVNARKRLEVAA